MKKWDEFESDMDSELSENFVAHTSRMFSSQKKGNTGNLESMFLCLTSFIASF